MCCEEGAQGGVALGHILIETALCCAVDLQAPVAQQHSRDGAKHWDTRSGACTSTVSMLLQAVGRRDPTRNMQLVCT